MTGDDEKRWFKGYPGPKPGDVVPVDGVWDATHHGHLVSDGPKEFYKGQRFTSCDGCSDRNAVRYTYRDPIT